MSIWVYLVIGLVMVMVFGLALWMIVKLITYCYYRFVSGMKPDEIQKQFALNNSRRPRVIWLYITGAFVILGYSGIYIDVVTGKPLNPQATLSATILDVIFFTLLWKRLGNKGWKGAIIGIVIGLLTAFIVGFLQG